MKSFNYIGFALAALSGMQLATAQEAAKLTAYAALPGAGATQLVLERGDGNGSFFYLQKGTDQLMQAKASTLKMFYIQTPADMANALRDYYGGEYAAARTDYKRLLALQPDHENGLLGLALLDQRVGRLQAAELQLTALVERHPGNATYLQARANVLIERQLYELALIDLEGAIALQPTDAYLYVARAELYLKMKRRTAAKADLDRAVALGLPRISLGELYQQCE